MNILSPIVVVWWLRESAKNVDFTTYSSAEKVVGYWTDGSPIYRRNFSGNFQAGTSRQIIKAGVNCSKITNYGGSFSYNEENDYAVPLSINASGQPNYYFTARVDSDNLEFAHGGAGGGRGSYDVWVEYLK